MTAEAKLTCMRCGRPVGKLSTSRARAYTFELTDHGVGPVCRKKDKGACRRARLARADGK